MSKIPATVNVNQEIAEGGRNNALARIAGQYFHKGFGLDEVLVLCKDWNLKKCKPPMGESELVTTVKSIQGKHMVNHPPQNPNLRPAPIEPTPKIDTGLPHDLAYPGGLLGEIMEYIELSSPVPHPLFGLAAAITLLGSVAGQRVMTESGLRTNFYNVILGYSGCGKGGPLGAIKNLMRKSKNFENIAGPTDIASAPALMRWLAGPLGTKAVTLSVLDEFGLIMRGMKDPTGHKAEIPRLLMELFTGTDSGLTKAYASGDPVPVHWHHLSLLGASTPLRFWESLTGSEVADGFLARMLVFESLHESPRIRKGRREITPPESLLISLGRIWRLMDDIPKEGNVAMIPEPFMVSKAQDAKDWLFDWGGTYHSLQNKHREESGVSAIYARAEEHAEKLALVHGLSRCGADVIDSRLELVDVKWAAQLVDYLIPRLVDRVKEKVSDNPHEMLCKRVLASVRKRATPHKPGATMRDICKDIGRAHSKWHIEKARDSLLASGELMHDQDWSPPRGRHPVGGLYRLAEEVEE
jgi:hypothetical protein